MTYDLVNLIKLSGMSWQTVAYLHMLIEAKSPLICSCVCPTSKTCSGFEPCFGVHQL